MHDPHYAYRPDIDGLRAVAVGLVVVFHTFPNALTGAFVGVDIFFVISGFLITTILLREAADGTFSVRAFYARRVKRLFPALAVVLVATLLAGWALLLRDEYRALGKHVAAGAGFLSNITLWAESGYFDDGSELKPLLHLWSLGIEEQFYFIWPLVIVAAARTRVSVLFASAVLLLASLSTNYGLLHSDPTGAYFLPHSRFWELMVGGVLAYAIGDATRRLRPLPLKPSHPRRRAFLVLAEVAASAGLLLIALAAIRLDSKPGLPAGWALLPALGAALVIGAGRHTWVARRVLSLRGLVYVGLISYPLYLWHWPLLSFARIVHGDLPPVRLRVALVAAAIFLAWATYRYWELPLRSMATARERSRAVVLGLATTLLALLLVGLSVNQGFPRERLAEFSAVLGPARADWDYPGDHLAIVPGTAQGAVLFFGDSYIRQLYPRVAYLTQRAGGHRQVSFVTAGGCAPVPGITRRSKPECADYSRRGFELAAGSQVDVVVIGSSWRGMCDRGDYYEVDDPDARVLDLRDPAVLDRVLGRLKEQLVALVAKGKAVYLVLNPPYGMEADPRTQPHARLGSGLPPEVKSIPMSKYLRRAGAINAKLRALADEAGAHVIDPGGWICSGDDCAVTDPQGIPRYKDSGHFRAGFVRCCVRDFDGLLQTDHGS